MKTNSTNRTTMLIITCSVFMCLCLCILFIGGVFVYRQELVKAVPALGPVLSAVQNTATTAPTSVPTPPSDPTESILPNEPAVRTVVVVTEIPSPTGPVATKTSSPLQATPTPTPTIEQSTPTRRPTSVLPAEWVREMDKIQQQVIELRGLQPSGDFTRDVLTPAELRENMIRDFNKDNPPEDMRNLVIEQSTLGLLEPGFDLTTFYIDLLSEQVAGYYDNETKEMFVIGEQFGGEEHLTYSHEYDHALQDQNYDTQNDLQINKESCERDPERCSAVRALQEGDATLVYMSWVTQYATAQDYLDILKFTTDLKMPVYDSAPEYLKEDLMFPYTNGLAFVEYLFDKGGWAAVNAAYADVPVSTEQIMHPERYPDDKPVMVELADFTSALGDGWQEIDRSVMGEWFTYLILAKGLDSSYRLDASTASSAAEGWGGDAYVAYYNEQSSQAVMVLSYSWDTLSDADEYTSALVQYGTLRFGQPQVSEAGQTTWDYANGYSIFRQAGQTSLWVIAPSQAAAEAVWAAAGP
jgi:hypothetical protein